MNNVLFYLALLLSSFVIADANNGESESAAGLYALIDYSADTSAETALADSDDTALVNNGFSQQGALAFNGHYAFICVTPFNQGKSSIFIRAPPASLFYLA